MTAIDPKVDLYLSGDWRDITTDVRQSPPIKITAGAKSEDTTVSPSQCTFTLNDLNGDYNRRNPLGAWHGSLGKNTRVRVSVPLLTDDVAQTVTDGWGTAGNHAWANGVSTGGTVADTDWTRTGTVLSHSLPAVPSDRLSELNTGSWLDSEVRFTVTCPVLNVTGTGAISSDVVFRATSADDYVFVRVQFATDETVNLGVYERIAGTARVLHADTAIGSLSTLTDSVYQVAALIEGPVVRAKVWVDGSPEPLDWQITCTRASVRAGYLGLLSRVSTGNSNSLPLVVSYDHFQVAAVPFNGEISEFTPGVGDESHAAPFVQITASGITRRVEQGSAPLKSPMFRWWSAERKWLREGAATATSATGSRNTLTSAVGDMDDVAVGNFFALVSSANTYKEDQLFTVASKVSSTITFTPDALESIKLGDFINSSRISTPDDNPIAYWPCEDERDSVSVASGLVGGEPLLPRVATPEFAAFDSFAGSAPILKLNNAELVAGIPDYTDTHEAFTIHFLLHMPDVDEAATGSDIVQFYTQGTAWSWDIQYAAGGGGGDLIISATGFNGAVLFSDAWDLGLRGVPRMVSLTVEQTGPSTVQYTVTAVEVRSNGGIDLGGSSPNTATATGVTTLGKITKIRVNPDGGYVNVGFGHLALVPKALRYFNLYNSVHGYTADNTAARMLRLADEEDVPLVFCQSPRPGETSSTLGPQRRETLTANLADAAEVDLGRFYESRGAYSFEYRARRTLFNQDPVLDLDYEGGAILADLTPTDDDQQTRNDVTVTRQDGSSARATLDEGTMSTLPPPDGVGRYTDAVTINAVSDTSLPDQAGWRLHLGTVDEFRYPTVRVTSVNGGAPLERLLSVGVGARIRLTNAAARGVFEPITQLVAGYTLILDRYRPVLEINGTPETPYHVAILDDPTCRLDSDTSTLAENLDTTETGVDVIHTGGRPWTTDVADMPFDILVGGERMTVTDIDLTGTQLFTVVRSVNGVVKTHPTGTPVSLAEPVYLAF